MWVVILGSIAAYLLVTRGAYGLVSWSGMCAEPADSAHTAEENTHFNRMLTAWLWPLMLLSLVAWALTRALSLFVTCGWRR